MATRNRARSLEQVLESYTRLTAPPDGWQLIIVDNGSTDSAPGVVHGFANRLPVTYLLEPQAGKSRALNAGLERATGDLVLFTDDDILPPGRWLTDYVETAASNPDFDIFGGPERPKWPFEPPSWAVCDERFLAVCFASTGPPRATGPTGNWLVGGNFAVRRRVLGPNRPFDTRLGSEISSPMGEEIELIGRLMRDGRKTWWIGDAAVEHMIRPEQVNKKWMLQRATQFGRGRYWLDEEYGRRVPLVAGMPRWLIRHAISQAARVAAAWIRRDGRELFVARWNLNVHRGALGEAWRVGGPRGSGGRAAR